MSYPQQPGNWSDPSWPQQQQQQPGYQDPAYAVSGQPAAAYPGYGYQPVAVQPTNGLAIAALVCALAGIATCISAPVGAILGHIARRQIRERGEAGDGMALAGIIVGWIITALMVLLIAFYVVIIILAINSDTTSSSY
jgi:hypothetical protein